MPKEWVTLPKQEPKHNQKQSCIEMALAEDETRRRVSFLSPLLTGPFWDSEWLQGLHCNLQRPGY